MRVQSSALASVAAVLGVPAVSLASGILVARFGGEHGHPTTNNPTAMYYNPAGISLGAGTRLYLDGTFAWRTFTYNRSPGAIDNLGGVDSPVGYTPSDAVGANSGQATLFNVLSAPFVGVVSDFGVPGLGVGLSFYAPFGGQSKWDKTDKVAGYPGAEDGPQRWWVMEGTIRSLYLTGAAAYRIEPARLSIGASFNMVKSQVNTARARLVSGHDHLLVRRQSEEGGSFHDLAEGRAVVDLSSWDPSIGLGLIYEPIDGMYIGLSYQSQPGFGENTLEGKSRTVVGSGTVITQTAELTQAMPDVIRAGWRMRHNASEYRVFGDFARWSVFEDQCIRTKGESKDNCGLANIPRNWENGFGVRVGYSHFLGADEQYELYGGAGYDSNAIPDATLEPALYDDEKVTASVGARFVLLQNSLALAATYTQVFYFGRETTPRPHDAANMESNVAGTPFAEARNPDAAGKYSSAVGAFNLNVEYAF